MGSLLTSLTFRQEWDKNQQHDRVLVRGRNSKILWAMCLRRYAFLWTYPHRRSAARFGKFGFYEGFKVLYGGIIGEESSYLNRMSLYLAASASAEFFADMFLAPFEAMKVRIQTMPGYANNMREAYAKMSKEAGNPFYKGLKPLWLRQIPYTMMKFSCFEKTVEMLYAHVVPKPRAECSKGEQLVVTFAAGYIAGVFCAIVSHPADCVVSVLNKSPNLTALQWFIYDSVKVALRLPRPPPPTMPESLRLRL